MSEEQAEPAPPAPALPPWRIEAARSNRSRCRTCRRTIDKGDLRLGVLLEGPYGTGYLWHHLPCGARRRFADVEQAYATRAWDAGTAVPDLAELVVLREEAEQRRAEKRELPYAERAPSGRSRCKQCGELVEKDAWRVALGRMVEFGGQVRTGPILVHAACVPTALEAEDCATEAESFAERLTENSGLSPADLAEVLKRAEAER